MLNIYTNTSLLTEENRSFVFPLLFDLFYGDNEYLRKHYKVVNDVNKSDVFIIPLEYTYALKSYNILTKELIKEAKRLKKNLWVYTGGDFGYSLKYNFIYNFRLGGFKSKLDERTFIMPSFINDPYSSNRLPSFKTLPKTNMPKIGFVGHANGSSLKYIRELLSYFKINIKRLFFKEKKDYQSFYPSSIKRASYLKRLLKSKALCTNFILRNNYRAGVKTKSEKKTTTLEFYNNIYLNAYTFCLRGAGNFSVRFYETLAVGRIPILINTDCKLPLSNIINWNNHCLIIDENEVENIECQIIKFHNKLSEDDFTQLQKNNRMLWESSLKREFFFKKIHDIFINKL